MDASSSIFQLLSNFYISQTISGFLISTSSGFTSIAAYFDCFLTVSVFSLNCLSISRFHANLQDVLVSYQHLPCTCYFPWFWKKMSLMSYSH